MVDKRIVSGLIDVHYLDDYPSIYMVASTTDWVFSATANAVHDMCTLIY